MNEYETAGSGGYQAALWPFEYVNITAGPNAANHQIGGVSNSGLWDQGWNQTQIRRAFAPCDMVLVSSRSDGANSQIWRSTAPVWQPGNASPAYLTFICSHSNTLPFTAVGTIISQGTHFYNTGTTGASAYHCHFVLWNGSHGAEIASVVGYNSYLGQNIYYSTDPPASIADMFYLGSTDEAAGSGGYGGQNFVRWTGGPGMTIAPLMLYWSKKRRVRHGRSTIFVSGSKSI